MGVGPEVGGLLLFGARREVQRLVNPGGNHRSHVWPTVGGDGGEPEELGCDRPTGFLTGGWCGVGSAVSPIQCGSRVFSSRPSIVVDVGSVPTPAWTDVGPEIIAAAAPNLDLTSASVTICFQPDVGGARARIVPDGSQDLIRGLDLGHVAGFLQ